MRKSIWLLSAGLVALATPAFAQQTDTDQGGANPTDGATAEGAAVDNDANSQQSIDTSDIVITATRRNEALSDVPLAVSAVTAESLQNSGATDIRQLTQVSPSLLVSSTTSEAGAGTARIRGIGTVGDNAGLESSVGVFIDGVYRSRAGVGLTELGPLDRIEVLRGPQGTLFGRNTSAGLISVLTAKPRFAPEVSGAVTIGNYNLRRLDLSVTGGLSETIAARLDGVYVKRDGFVEDVVSGRDVNDRNRWLLRGQLLFQPTDNFSNRFIVDYTKRDEECCAAPYLPAHDTVGTGGGNYTFAPSSYAAIIRGLGGIVPDDTFERDVAITPGRSYRSDVDDWGLSNEAVYDFGAAELTSISGYRYNKYTRGTDADYNTLDILYRDDDGSAYNRFKTFSQELRLQGTTFGGKLDWLVGGYYANENLKVRDNLRYGNDYGRYANCVIGAVFQANFAPLLSAPLVDPTNQTCFNPTQAGTLIASPFTDATNDLILSAFARLGPFAAGSNSGFVNVASFFNPANATLTLNDRGLTDVWDQTSNNFALFTHNIFSLTDAMKLTVGLRYTNETKRLRADLNDNNGLCTQIANFASGLQNLPCVIPALAGGSLNGSSKREENKLSGTAVLSWKPTDTLLTYLSYSRGYKAGGFNLDRSALSRSVVPSSTGPAPGPVCSGVNVPATTPVTCTGPVSFDVLQFKPEINDAFELGAKFNGRGIDVNVALFNQMFRDFQLNTFNGIQFIVENVNSCSDALNGKDRDNDPYTLTGKCTGKTRPGVRSRGIEFEMFTRPMTDVAFNLGATVVSTKYRSDLVGADGRALPFALFQLPERRLSNSAKGTVTSSISFNPRVSSNGMRALFYLDGRYSSRFNTGSDLDLDKLQRAYTVLNGRVGLQGPGDVWSVELWGQNLLNRNFIQVGFDAFAQGSCSIRGAAQGYCLPASALNPGNANRATQLFGAFLGEPRTFGLTFRGKLGMARPAAPAYVAPPAPLPPPATKVCPDGSVIDAAAPCPAPVVPPAPPAPKAGERG